MSFDLLKKLDLIASSDHSEPQKLILQDHNRNGIVGMSGLARLSEMNTKTILTEQKYMDLMFVFARHVTFNDINTCLSQSSYSLNGIDAYKSSGIPSLNNSSYFSEYGKASYWFINSVKKINLLPNVTKDEKYIGHTIGLGVQVDSVTRTPKPVTSVFKKYVDNKDRI